MANQQDLFSDDGVDALLRIVGGAGEDPKPTPAEKPKERPSFPRLLAAVKDAGEDFEWYPTTDRMIEVVTRHIDTTAESIMDIGAGDGRVLTKLGACFENSPLLYAIEKSSVLMQSWPENIVPVGTDLFEQNLSALPCDYLFCNPPYSEFELWARIIIEAGYARKAFLVIPQRWKENEAIALALKARGATARVIHSDNFHDAQRQARAVVDVVEISYPMQGREYRRYDKPSDPFDRWFDENISTFEAEEPEREYEAERRDLAKIREHRTITDLVEAYAEEYARMEKNYRAIFELDYQLLKELGVSKANVREGIKKKMAGLKSKYWTVLFERLDAVTDRLSTGTKKKFTERLVGRIAVAFTTANAYAVVLWAIKNANLYFEQQAVQLYKDLSTFEGAMAYKSNQRTWKQDDWRYRFRDDDERSRSSHYGLELRIVVNRYGGVSSENWDHPGGLARSCHELLADVLAVFYNLGFRSYSPRSLDRRWISGEKQEWATTSGKPLFQVRAFRNGNLHFKFAQDAMRALNVEAGRLLGWLRAPDDVVSELGYTKAEAEKFFHSTNLIGPSIVAGLLTGSAD